MREEDGGAAVESVASLTRRIKALLEGGITPCWVRGEVSNVRHQASGHVYFSLKDAESQISCVMFRGDVARSGVGDLLRDGAQLIVFGEISVYEPRGNYQLLIRAAIDDGRGRLQQEFERLKARLAEEGLFDPARKKSLPPMPRTVGFITSPTGAAVQDFIRILKRRQWRGRLVVLPAKVQGEGAAAELYAQLELAHELAESPAGPHFDLLVIGRGGGSLEDLWAFNEEPLVRAVAGSRIPIVSAVGHEIDFTLCDFAADVRAETPSAAAELISSGFLAVIERLRQAWDGLDGTADETIRRLRDQVEISRGRLATVSPRARLERALLQLDDVANRLGHAIEVDLHRRERRVVEAAGRMAAVAPERRLERLGERFRAVATRFVREGDLALAAKRDRLETLAARLAQLDPDAVLRRGYTIVRDQDGRPVPARAGLAEGQSVRVQFSDGEAAMRVDQPRAGPGA
ncbi:MAG: exodeoxyribonuclease VII large subunit [Opitutaceae bacterium]|nr:exodeoxyribonuclease VII large subunit [Opitutaceae bacterium]